MKRSLALHGIILCFAVLFSACEKDEAPVVPFLTVDMTQTDEGRWIFATNEKGELLDIVRADLTNRSVRQFKTNKRYSSVDLTYLRMERDPQIGTVYAYGNTYRNIPTAITVNAGLPPVPAASNTIIGTANIIVKNYTGSRADVIVATQRGHILQDEAIVDGQQMVVNINVYTNSENLIISTSRNGVPVYFIQKLPAGNTTLEVDFNSFIPMENIVALKESMWASIDGLDASGYFVSIRLLSRNNYDGNSPISIGSIPGFARYISFLLKPGQAYLKVGSPIAVADNVEEKFIGYTLNVTNSNIKTFSVNFSTDYDYKIAYPISEVGPVSLSWGVWASANDEARMLFDIPQEIISEYPELADYSIPEQGSATIYKSLNNSFTYSDFLDKQLLFDYTKDFEQLIISR